MPKRKKYVFWCLYHYSLSKYSKHSTKLHLLLQWYGFCHYFMYLLLIYYNEIVQWNCISYLRRVCIRMYIELLASILRCYYGFIKTHRLLQWHWTSVKLQAPRISSKAVSLIIVTKISTATYEVETFIMLFCLVLRVWSRDIAVRRRTGM